MAKERVIVIAISGKAESGKDTLARYILDKSDKLMGELGLVEVKHIADTVKCIATSDFNWDGNKDVKGRELLQMIGDGGRKYDKNIWIDKFIDILEATFRFGTRIVLVPDTRYENEINYLRDWTMSKGGKFYAVRVERPFHVNKLTEEQRNNSSETDLDCYTDWDKVVFNTGTLSKLKRDALNIIGELEIE